MSNHFTTFGRFERVQYDRGEALEVVRTHSGEGQQAALIPVLEAAPDIWRVDLQADGRDTMTLWMRLDPVDAILHMRVTKRGRIKSLSLRDATGPRSLDTAEPDSHWPEPVPAYEDWASVAADWVKARTAEVSGDAAVRLRIEQLEAEFVSVNSELRVRRRQAEELSVRAGKIDAEIQELKAKLS